MRIQTVIKKTLEDFSQPKFLAMFLVPFLIITVLFAAGITSGAPSDLASQPLPIQERELMEYFTQFFFIWIAGLPVMALIAILSANHIASEEEDGSLRILLSKPVRRWEVILGKFLSIFLFSLLVILAGMFLGFVLVFNLSGASSAAIGGGLMSLIGSNIVYGVFVSLFVSSLGTGFSVFTGSRLKTAVSVILLSVVLLFGFIIIRMATEALGLYKDYFVYTIDINYHLGNSYVFILKAFTGGLAPPVQSALSNMTGTFDSAAAGIDPLIGGMPSSIPLSNYVSPAVSFVAILAISIGLLSYSVYEFKRKDIL